VHWVLGISDVFLITVGAVPELAKVLAATADFQSPPPNETMKAMVEKQGIEPLF
jgi:hypothetical protein